MQKCVHIKVHRLCSNYSRYLFGGGTWALISHVVGCGSQVHNLRRDPSLPRGCSLCCLDYVYALGGNGFLFVFEVFSRLAIVRRAAPVLLVVTMETITIKVQDTDFLSLSIQEPRYKPCSGCGPSYLQHALMESCYRLLYSCLCGY